MKLVKLSSKSDRDIIDKESDEGGCIDRVDDKKYYERYQIGEIHVNEIDLEEPETDERYQIEYITTYNRINNQ